MVKERVSAGILMYRVRENRLEVLLAHPGGPLYEKKDHGHWTVPKGMGKKNETLLETAVREFSEETGLVPQEPFIELGSIRQKGGKLVHAWACAGDVPEGWVPTSETFKMRWPPLYGIERRFPEVDRAEFFSVPEALARVKETQRPLITTLQKALGTEN